MANKNCLRQSAMGVGDCAGLPEDELKAAMEESARRLEARRARDALKYSILSSTHSSLFDRALTAPSARP